MEQERPGELHLSLRVSGQILALNDDDDLAVVVGTVEEAVKWYRQVIQEVEAGDWDEIIHEHIARIPPKKRRK